ncbi:unnamed protein product [Coffea canephora]|uniref:(+)-lariciresinol reductase n=1 Tax=Coffea canephora TaxID=49390 RepID=A0A068VNP6_COFCA|nr:unnamed protein product [Coffea canephora]
MASTVESVKSKVLIIGGTGYLGKRLVKASLEQGHETYILHRPEIGVDIEKVQMLLSFKARGAHLVPGSFSHYQSLVDAVKLVDVVRRPSTAPLSDTYRASLNFLQRTFGQTFSHGAVPNQHGRYTIRNDPDRGVFDGCFF